MAYLSKIFFWDSGFKKFQYLDYLEFFHQKKWQKPEKKVNFKTISVTAKIDVKCTIWPSGIKKDAKLTDILSAAPQKNINPEDQSFPLTNAYFINNRPCHVQI